MIKSKYKKGWVEININDLVSCDWNYKTDDEKKAEKLKNNIKRNGQIENIIVRELDTGFYEIVNGNHRYMVLKELGIEKVMCFNLEKISLAQAKRIAIETNETKFETDNVKLAGLISEISQEFDLTDLVDTMPYSEVELNNFNQLLDFDWNQFSDNAKSSEESGEEEESEVDEEGEQEEDEEFEENENIISFELTELMKQDLQKIKSNFSGKSDLEIF